MKSFRDHVEDLVFNLEQPLIIPTNNNFLNRGNCKFVLDKTSLDWYNARLSMDFKLTKLTGLNVIINDKNGIVNGTSSFVKKISFSINGREIYRCNSANHVVNIKNLLDYKPSYAETIGTNELYYLDTTNSPNRNKYLTRQVQHGRNNANTGWTPEIFIENEDTTLMRGLIYERNNWEIRALFIVKFLLIAIHFLRLLKIRCYQSPDSN